MSVLQTVLTPMIALSVRYYTSDIPDGNSYDNAIQNDVGESCHLDDVRLAL
jgi:hypothetical protein